MHTVAHFNLDSPPFPPIIFHLLRLERDLKKNVFGKAKEGKKERKKAGLCPIKETELRGTAV
jgi:hypothetical protein